MPDLASTHHHTDKDPSASLPEKSKTEIADEVRAEEKAEEVELKALHKEQSHIVKSLKANKDVEAAYIGPNYQVRNEIRVWTKDEYHVVTPVEAETLDQAEFDVRPIVEVKDN